MSAAEEGCSLQFCQGRGMVSQLITRSNTMVEQLVLGNGGLGLVTTDHGVGDFPCGIPCGIPCYVPLTSGQSPDCVSGICLFSLG